MIKWLNENIFKFRNSFSRRASFQWFVIVIIWLMTRKDFQGITGAIRDLFISPHLYTALLNFFHAKSWNIDGIVSKWVKIIKESGCLMEKDGYYILLGDGIKKGKETKKMPAVKKHHQESENTTKPTYIFGHLFGVVGLLIGNQAHKFCVPVSAQIQNGANIIRNFSKENKTDESHVVQMLKQGCQVASLLQHQSVLVLDRYFLTAPALEALANFKKENPTNEKPIPKERRGRGRPALVGAKIKLQDLFVTQAERFQTAKVVLYGQNVKVSYLCINCYYHHSKKKLEK